MSTAFVIFGATGDLTRRKLIPSLFRLYRTGRIPDCSSVWGVGRRAMSDDEFRASLRDGVREFGDGADDPDWDDFAAIVSYHVADISDAQALRVLDARMLEREGLAGGDRLYYLALPPGLYPGIIGALVEAGLSHEVPAGPCRRVIVEKPFGRDQGSARDLVRLLHSGFEERQIYRIDHYLGKETVQNIHVLRFANAIFEPVWDRRYVDSVQITVAEELGVGHRGPYYDQAGVLRDMFQSHLLQLLSLTAMEPPARFEAELLRNEKVKVLAAIRPISPESIAESSVRGQYEGYRSEPGVEPASTTATFAALELYIDNWRWQGVPFYLRSGKAMETRCTEITIRFKKPPVRMFGASADPEIAANQLTICIQPDEAIHLRFETKVPDMGFEMRPSELDFHYRQRGAEPLPDAYERLLVDALHGDASLFARADEIELAWSVVDPIVAGWQGEWAPSLASYARGTWGPAESDAFLARRGRRWIHGCVGHDHDS